MLSAYKLHVYLVNTLKEMLGVVARSDARPPGMRTVGGSILTSGNILS